VESSSDGLSKRLRRPSRGPIKKGRRERSLLRFVEMIFAAAQVFFRPCTLDRGLRQVRNAPFGAPIPERDAAIVTRLKAAGAIIIAKVSAENWFGWDGFLRRKFLPSAMALDLATARFSFAPFFSFTAFLFSSS